MTVLAILGLLLVLFLLVTAYGWWMKQGLFGWWMAYNLLEPMAACCSMIFQLIVAALSSNDN